MIILAEKMSMKTIMIYREIGTDLRTRSFFRRDIEGLLNHDTQIVIDFSGVTFVSRSVADEICNVLADYPNLSLRNMAGDVKMMYDVVVRGRSAPRRYDDLNAKHVTLRTMEDLQSFFSKL